MNSIRFFNNFEKEEHWLEEMSAKGLHLSGVSSFGRYMFKEGEPENRKYRIDYRVFNKKSDMEDYIQLFADSGWKCAHSSMYNGNQYFYSTDPAGSEDIFSDQYSKAQRYSRFSKQFGMMSFVCLIPYISLYTSGVLKFRDVRYLTPGLWEKTGWDFVSHFLFETPFVMLRSFGFLLPLLLAAIFIFLYLRSLTLYKQAQKG